MKYRAFIMLSPRGETEKASDTTFCLARPQPNETADPTIKMTAAFLLNGWLAGSREDVVDVGIIFTFRALFVYG